MCTCESCTNLENAASKLLENNVQNVSYHRKRIIDSSWCQYKAKQFSYTEENFDLEEREFPHKDCILRRCQNCGVARVRSLISPGLTNLNLQKQVTWKAWKTVDDEYDVYQVTGTLQELIEQYLQIVDVNSFHVFMSYYQDHQYNLCLKNLCKGQVVFVHDYAQNILMKNQDEVQTKHWSHRQLTVHPSIAFYLCPNCQKVLVRETIIHLTEDKKHDWKAVCHFQNLNLRHLISQGITVCQIHEWSDQAPTQYKSRNTFNVQSNSVIPQNRHFYCTRHGKGPSDRATGLFKLWLNLQVKTGKLILHDYKMIADYATKHHSKQPETQSECMHTRRKIFYTSKIPRKKYSHFKKCTKPAKEHRLIHSARSVANPGFVETRNFDCCCPGCMQNTGKCENDLADEYTLQSIKIYNPYPKTIPNIWRKLPRVKKNVVIAEDTEENEAELKRLKKLRSTETKKNIEPLVDEHVESTPNKLKENVKGKVEVVTNLENSDTEKRCKLKSEDYKENKCNDRKQKMKPAKKIEVDRKQPCNNRNTGPKTRRQTSREEEKTKAVAEMVVENMLETEPRQGESIQESEKMGEITDQIVLTGRDEESINPSEMKMEKKYVVVAENVVGIEVFNWSEVYQNLVECATFDELGPCLTDIPRLRCTFKSHASKQYIIDVNALGNLPDDAPQGYVPLVTIGDGNCFPRAVSHFLFGDETHHLEIRIRILKEAVDNLKWYTSDEYLSRGQSKRCQWSRVVTYSLFSPAHDPDLSVEEVYKREVMTIRRDGAYMGVWQFHQLANVVHRPVICVYPDEASENVREHLNRTFIPMWGEQSTPLMIEWTPIPGSTSPNHFVPLMLG